MPRAVEPFTDLVPASFRVPGQFIWRVPYSFPGGSV